MAHLSWRRPLILLVLLGAFCGPGVALAASSATRTSASLSVAVPTWSVGLAPDGSSTYAQTSMTSALDKDYFYSFKNVGSATLSSRFAVAIPMSSTNGVYADLEFCDVGWNTTTDSCTSTAGTAGTVSVVAVTGSTYSFTLPVAFPPGATLTLRVHPSVPDSVNTATFGVQISNVSGAGVTTDS